MLVNFFGLNSIDSGGVTENRVGGPGMGMALDDQSRRESVFQDTITCAQMLRPMIVRFWNMVWSLFGVYVIEHRHYVSSYKVPVN